MHADDIGARIEDATHDIDVPNDLPATIQRAIDNYGGPVKLVAFETIQNAHEAFVHNMDELGVVPDDRKLTLLISIDSDGTLVLSDNAGGVGGADTTTSEKLFENYLGMDKPGVEKQDGDYSGGYGRGATTVLGLGTEGFYVETKHDGTHVATTGDMMKAKAETPTEDVDGLVEESGTTVVIKGLEQEAVDALSDREAMAETVRKKFPPLAASDDVEIIHEIDGEAEEINGVDIERLRDVAPVDADYPKTLEAVEKGNESYQITGVELFDARKLPDGEDAPWKGVMFMNTDDRGDFEMAVKQEYTPDKCRAVSQGELFGWVDFSEFCSKYEDSSHDGFSRGLTPSETGVKDVLQELSRTEFAISEDDRNVGAEALEEINEKFSKNDVLTVGEGEAEAESGDDADDETEETEETGQDTEETDPKRDGPLSATASTESDADGVETVTVTFALADDATGGKLTNVSVREIINNTNVADPKPRQLAAGEATTVTFTAEEDGRYIASAALRDPETDEKVGKASAFVTVGDTAAVGDEDGGGISFVDDHAPMGLGETDQRAMAFTDDGGNLVLALNTDRHEYDMLTENNSQRRNDNNVEGLYYKWGLQAIEKWMIGKNDAAEFVDERKTDQSPEDALSKEFARMEIELIKGIEGRHDILGA